MWLPLLGTFIWLAGAGWNEYQKVQAYEAWATGFERSKYDILAMLGQAGDTLTWGRPTRRGPIDLASLSLQEVETLGLRVNGQPVPPVARLPRGQQVEIVFSLRDGGSRAVPFTDSELGRRWEKALQESLQALKSASA